MSDQESEEAGNGAAPSAMPLFYRSPMPVNAERHAKWGVRDTVDHGFAAKTSVVPINIGEMAVAAKVYPIVFSVEPPHLPVAICGLRNEDNVFISAQGTWSPDSYVPAYVRRYPFIFMETPEQKRMILCVDEESVLVGEGAEQPLFDDSGKQTEIVDRALEFCRMYHQQHNATRDFVAALVERDLLVENSTEIKLGESRRLELKGYRIVDREKLDALPDEDFLELRKRGWLPAIYYHLQSGSNWPNVMRHAGLRAAEKKGDTDPVDAPASGDAEA